MKNRKKLLIIDDDHIVRESLICFFEDKGWQVTAFSTAEKGLNFLQQLDPAAAIVDIRLPGLDGNVFMREALKMLPQLVILVCTGSPEYSLPHELQSVPNVSNHIFFKPVSNMEKFEAEILRLLPDHT